MKRLYGLIVFMIAIVFAFGSLAHAGRILKSIKCIAGKQQAVCHIMVYAPSKTQIKTTATVNCVRYVRKFVCDGTSGYKQCTHVVKVHGKSGTQCIISVQAGGENGQQTFTFK